MREPFVNDIIWDEEKKEIHPVSASCQIGYYFKGEDKKLLSDLNEQDQQQVIRWIKHKLSPRQTYNNRRTSYGLKHILHSDTGIYLTNNQFKDAMLICGYYPKNKYELNWNFQISEQSIAFTGKRMKAKKEEQE